ncbi:membrane protein insertase YidC [Hymenobacter busanensis]|uniref:Membrane protein insertase YidC n=1 Tax=Hymenobacter busanensis TaxID=2607656 RepID=A0A7L5A2L8_9BACT|nr:membrane protein insertase YidC [Hymenobacter busanensis]KAA9338209.1 membrane protein insertase YidC [Hymenobacter busanensis]QHJ09366.1 membrane protein insertase YidC [Hymenobacter busanensis]
MDKNQATGLMLISALLLAYLFFFKPKPAEEQAAKPTTTTAAQAATPAAPAPLDSAARARTLGAFAAAGQGTAETVELRNDKLTVTLSTQGGRPEVVMLNKEKTFFGQPFYLLDKQSGNIDVQLPLQDGRKVKLSSLFFRSSGAQPVAEGEKKGQRVTFTAELAPGQQVLQTYTLLDNSYQIDYNLKLAGLSGVVSAEPLTLTWLDRVRHTEQSLKQNRNHSTINYYLAEDDLGSIAEASEKPEEQTAPGPVKWVGHKHDFFTAGLIAGKEFPTGKFNSNVSLPDSTFIKTLQSTVQIAGAEAQSAAGAQMQYYFGPNKFSTLKAVAPNFERNVYLGWGVFRYVNRFLVIPVFSFLEQFISSYGLIIVILVVLIKLLFWPLVYKSYLSQAKMRVLKPEVDAIKEKYGDDQMKVQSETMKLYQSTGSSPLSGCIPMLATIPVLLALFQFFPNAIELRGESFLWAKDLSTYDAPIRLPFELPYLGSHISLFTLLMTASTLLMTWQSNQLNPSAMQGPMKVYSYLMPLIFFFVLNDYPAGLTWYYFVSNIVTFAQQAITRRFVDEDKLHAQLQANKEKNKDKKPAGFQARLAEAMKAAQEREVEAKKQPQPKKK